MYRSEKESNRLGHLLSAFYPDERAESVYEIDFEAWYRKGFRGLEFDVDNTLVPHGAPADVRSVELFRKLRGIGFRTCLISNNRRTRVEPFAEALGTEFISMANKPFTGGYRRGCAVLGTDERHTLFIGDQLFTDVWGARKAGIYTILVNPINPKEEIQIVLKRKLEKKVLDRYERDRRG
jgi:HAD superfamily phosphatase (TIGR01668 family)